MARESDDADMETGTRYHGSLVAFEGPADVVSTQLRLLPTSSQVLILPSVQHYMASEDSGARFNARSYIKDVHQAVLARREVALQFLNGSGKDSKRLVFLNGGTAGAVSNCISALSDRQASEDVLGAEAIFRDMVSEGVSGLYHEEKYSNPDALGILDGDDLLPGDEEDEDPITKAMRAADALYKETESLQPIDCYIRTRPRSLSLPMLPYLDGLGEVSPCFMIGSPENEEARSVFDSDEDEEEESASHRKVTMENLSRWRALKNLQGVPPHLKNPVPNRPPSFAAEAPNARNTIESRSTVRFLSPTTDHFMSPPLTPEGVVYGEARMVQMQASRLQKALRKIRSLDDMDLDEARSRRASLQVDPVPNMQAASPTESPEARSRHLSIVEDPYSSNNLLHLPEARFVKAQTTTIRRSPIFTKPLPELPRDSYVHQGTDAADFDGEQDDESNRAFEPVLPLQEDLVIHFTSETPDYVLDSVMQSFKDGSYPITRSLSASHTSETDSFPSTPRTADLFNLEESQGGLSPVAEVASADEASDYDPYAAHGNDVRSSYMPRQQQQPQQPSPPPPLRIPHQPPTPAQTPSIPGGVESDSKFHEFSISGRANAVATQNALRLVLEVYFPPHQEGGYHQFNSALLHGLDSLWRPIFGDSETPGGNASEKAADLILAIGCQKSVKREFLMALTGQVERLGSKSSGLSRSGRLDLRYLIANAMQSCTTLPLTNQEQHNPLDNPYIIACLLVPHLETYLAANTHTRFLLLEYPTEHLATVLALQKLVGPEILKVSGILDSDEVAASPATSELPSPLTPNGAGTPLPTTTTTTDPDPSLQAFHQPGPIERALDAISLPGSPFPMSPVLSARGQQQHHQHQRRPTIAHRRRFSFSKADYLLTSSATEAEIATFISTVCKVLVAADPFYMPEQLQQQQQQQQQHGYGSPSHGRAKPTARAGAGAGVGIAPLISKFTFPTSPPLSPPGAGAGEHVVLTTPITPRSNASAVSFVPTTFPHVAPLSLPLPLPPPPPPPPRDESPSRTSIRSATRGRQQQHHHIANVSAAQQQPQQQQSRARSRSLTRSLARHRAAAAARKGGGGEEDGGEDAASMYAVSVVDEGEFYDDEERRLMPMYMRQSEMRKGNSRKALKWLGLA